MRILFLLYHYPPLPGISPKRNYLISAQLASRAKQSFVFTSTFSKENRDLKNIKVEAIPAYDLRTFQRNRSESAAVTDSKKNNPWHQRMLRLLNTFPVSVLINEGGPTYLFNLIRKGNKTIREENITHIYSAFRPLTDHVAAYVLKKQNPDVKWIADFRDLPFDPYFNKIYFKKFHQRLFRRILSRADVITTVSEGLRRHLLPYNENVIVIRNGLTHLPETMQPNPSLHFTIAYTGSMYLDKKNARPLFIALSELINEKKIDRKDIRIIYAGKDSFYWTEMADAFDLMSSLDIRGHLSSSDAMVIQKKSCVNILLSVSSPQLTGILTGKMIEYIEAGSPILAIISQQIDPELYTILNELNIGKSFSDHPEDIVRIKDFLLDEYTYWKRTGMNRKPVDIEVLKRYVIEETIKPLTNIFLGP